VDEGKPDSWAYRWTFTCLANGGLTALPNCNLVSNVGFGEDASHTTCAAEATLADHGLGVLTHPRFLLRDKVADRYSFVHHFGGAVVQPSNDLLLRVKARLRKHWHQLRLQSL
jgi:hypothetical protein